MPVDLIDVLGTRYTRYASIETDTGREHEFGEIVNAGTFRRVYTIRAAPVLLTRQWQLVDLDPLGELWEIEHINPSHVPGDRRVHCVRYADRFDDAIPSPLNRYATLWGDQNFPAYDGYTYVWGDHVGGFDD